MFLEPAGAITNHGCRLDTSGNREPHWRKASIRLTYGCAIDVGGPLAVVGTLSMQVDLGLNEEGSRAKAKE